jgi:hypothetical protein
LLTGALVLAERRQHSGDAPTTKRRAASMYTLPVSQCPKCVLRFGSPSERDQHLRDDHRLARRERLRPVTQGRDNVTTAVTKARPDLRLPRLVTRGILAVAILASVAVVYWDAAAILTVFVVAGLAGWALRRRDA